jgi:hypothetical protein
VGARGCGAIIAIQRRKYSSRAICQPAFVPVVTFIFTYLFFSQIERRSISSPNASLINLDRSIDFADEDPRSQEAHRACFAA